MAIDGRHPGARCLLVSVSSDAHTWNLVFLELWLAEHGHRVTNLGSCTQDRTTLDACRSECPDALIVSTVNGHGHLDGLRLIRALRRDPALRGLPAVIGGRLGVHGGADAALHARLSAAGFDAVLADDGAGTGVGGGDTLDRLDSFLHGLPGRHGLPDGRAA